MFILKVDVKKFTYMYLYFYLYDVGILRRRDWKETRATINSQIWGLTIIT